MTPQEFKAWFTGYAENISAAPTEEQWKRICARVDEVDGAPITPIYVEHRWPFWGQPPSYWVGGVPYWANTCGGTSPRLGSFTVNLTHTEGDPQAVSFTNNFDALYALGKAESMATFTQ